MSRYETFCQSLNRSYIPALDGVRFFAVFLVVFYHMGFDRVPGSHGVMLFFVLSGFLITWLLLKENEKTGTVSIKDFFRRRVLRIFPAFYFYCLVTLFMLTVLHKEIPWTHVLSAVFYVSNYFYALHPESNNAFSHTWSLAIEEQFYLLFPVLFFAFRRSLKRMTIAFGGLILLVWLWRVVLVYALDVSDGYIYTAFDTRIDNLLIGCLAALIIKQKLLKNFWEAMLQSRLMPWLTISMLLLSIFILEPNIPRYRDIVGLALDAVLMAILIMQLIHFSGTSAWSWLERKEIKYLGRISYPLYLYQQLTIFSVQKFLIDQPLWFQMAAVFAVTVCVASLSYYFVEQPFLKLKKKGIESFPKRIEPAVQY
jgi:peptidoglycan/LPS O-acetylase OafA/YrhL